MTIPKGKYTARAVDAAFGQNKNDNDYVFIRFEITEGELEGEEVSGRFYLTEKTAERTIEGLRYCGCTFPDDDITNLNGLGNKLVQLVIVHERGNDGKTYYRIRWINRHGSGVPKKEAMTPQGQRHFADRMRGHLLAGQQSSGYEAPTPPPVDDSDIPF